MTARDHTVIKAPEQGKASTKQSIKGKKGTSKVITSKKAVKKKPSKKSAVSHSRSGTKTRLAKNLQRTSKRSGSGKPGPLSSTEYLPSIALPGQGPSDLWLAKEDPTAYEILKREELSGSLDKLTLNILYSAYHYLGTPYRYGGTTPAGFDCSGFVQHIFGENGITLGRSSRDQAREGVPVQLSELKPGDLIFFNMRPRKHSSIDHVGLYIGNGQFIHASSYRSREITIENLETGSYLNRLVGARRILEYTSDEAVVIE